jgi:hypothetical protein
MNPPSKIVLGTIGLAVVVGLVLLAGLAVA